MTPGEVLAEVDSEELNLKFYLCLSNVNWGVLQRSPPPGLHNHLLGLFHI